jgi:exosortase
MSETMNAIQSDETGGVIQRFEWLLAILLALVFAPAGIALGEVWSSVDYYSHGFLVPLVAYWASAQGRARFSILADRDRRGFLLLVVALCGFGMGSASGVPWLQGLALIAALVACTLYLGGAAGVRALAFPLSFLIFMVPLPPSWITPIIVKLQLIVSETAVTSMGWLGSEVIRNGNVILLPGGDSLFVAEACSGITSIVTLIPLAVMLAYFTVPTLGRKIILVGAVIPAAMLGNWLRVSVTVAAAERYGAAAATGNWLHESAGMLSFGLACFALIGLGALMRRVPSRRL